MINANANAPVPKRGAKTASLKRLRSKVRARIRWPRAPILTWALVLLTLLAITWVQSIPSRPPGLEAPTPTSDVRLRWSQGRERGQPPIALSATSTPSADTLGDPAQGSQLFRARCSACHLTTSTTARVGPGLKGLFQQERLSRTGWTTSEENVRKVIQEGSGSMPSFRRSLTNKQLDDLIAYLKTL